ncbi:hypothetical protein CO110_05470 [Candidatus Desantisbacteria bacterium CG_4_9_14_3_um_filter_40_11]|uniref:RHS repeat protein n=4 Tax=unclassified Candidatus Desantisiibacteriota TaxID=3106372 RepID=A0A2M7JD60_9BACT|nr:MAG: hypothetical protein COX18_07545 [Candidatus Desantisbacteria bacterium CG23_combo_of_CG06-09_8_20_14_all_40_23]PIX17369.1 MAG: hypothetical protein COZ71_03690 [Candidatus Desantisbacteria bacterium CG_4_8_14_3_um_filter_40_12]PIY19806.1 MAG: hypothetical protein COZ13_03465 [Candidatus Desantisbacteria bacterium CG_4_10_14_3_um_filter_40_18]PJB29497.1 MAG: hypothetical protein CO110_05470 [Candidatus Desantisbacteria bacterium CG_4_9_14_3_um_filter_40_11]
MSVVYTYDNVGNLLDMIDTHGKTTYNYDSSNRLTQETQPNGV